MRRRGRCTRSGSSPIRRRTTETSCAPRLHSAFSSSLQHAQVEAVAVQVEERAELAARRSAPSAGRRRGGTRAGGRPSGSSRRCAAASTAALGLGRGGGERLLDEAVLARLRRPATASSAWVGTGVASTTASSSSSASSSESSPRRARAGEAPREPLARARPAGSQSQRSSQPAIASRLRARFGPQ